MRGVVIGVASLVLAACAAAGIGTVPDTKAEIQGSVPAAWEPIVERYRLSYVAEMVEQFRLTDADLATIEVQSLDPQPYDAFPTRADYDWAFAGFVADCLRRRGYPAEVVEAAEGPGVDVGGLVLDDPDVARVHGLCVVEALLRFPPRPRPVTQEEWLVVYEEQVATAQCLEERFGYEARVPTFDAFVDDPSAWVAYDAVPEALGPGRWEAINEACPQP